MSTIEKAKLFAFNAHGDQMYGEFPYSRHLQNVVDALNETYPTCRPETDHPLEQEMNNRTAVTVAAWLHDTIEDTSVTFEDVFNEFGRIVARIVFACTDEPGKNRKERHERTYPKLIAAGRDAIAVKLADRIANVRHSVTHNHGMFQMYQKEYAEFKKALHLPGELKEMWATLDVLMQHKVE
jgi:guanosine-3',5'-bis(diphosphate) 3'-pyrophosphohydrolase